MIGYNLNNQVTFMHHRSGWGYAIKSLMPIHHNHGTKFIGFLDRCLGKQNIDTPFVGFLHNPLLPLGISEKYQRKNSLYEIFNSHCWIKNNEKMCSGLYVMSEDLKKKLKISLMCLSKTLYTP